MSAVTTASVDRTAPARRVLGLARANARLLLRNRLTAVYALALPLLPLALLVVGRDSDSEIGAGPIGSVLMLAMVFPVFYSLLSQVVTRRDELVLKRLRTGEARDREILLAIALPGVVIALGVAVVAVPVGMLLGMSFPSNPLLYVVGVLVASAVFAAFAFWTAAWTRNAEAAQMTSAPVILLAVVGNLAPALPGAAQRVAELTPAGALDTLVDAAWSGDGFVASWTSAGEPVLLLVAWTAVAVELARRSMRWEPRT